MLRVSPWTTGWDKGLDTSYPWKTSDISSCACTWLFVFNKVLWERDQDCYKSHCAWDCIENREQSFTRSIFIILTWFGGRLWKNWNISDCLVRSIYVKTLRTLFVYIGPSAPAVQLDSANYTGATVVPWLQAHVLPFLLILTRQKYQDIQKYA